MKRQPSPDIRRLASSIACAAAALAAPVEFPLWRASRLLPGRKTPP